MRRNWTACHDCHKRENVGIAFPFTPAKPRKQTERSRSVSGRHPLFSVQPDPEHTRTPDSIAFVPCPTIDVLCAGPFSAIDRSTNPSTATGGRIVVASDGSSVYSCRRRVDLVPGRARDRVGYAGARRERGAFRLLQPEQRYSKRGGERSEQNRILPCTEKDERKKADDSAGEMSWTGLDASCFIRPAAGRQHGQLLA